MTTAEENNDSPIQDQRDSALIAPCPQCGFPMMAVRGSRDATCANCGFKDSCCY